ncbi:putative nesprin-1 isoform X3 [Apostichopus japonicus]|uniref:Putative nesprin-1 isoform X3 n=1 Tax=Stichopus japonicus TaxID=307972 RepID=A0A2G8KXL3_STIJA|nr:putative nesprin-1 isoform X3 [Apostichopus japonicus]
MHSLMDSPSLKGSQYRVQVTGIGHMCRSQVQVTGTGHRCRSQVSDQQSRLEQSYDFQSCYQDALQAASSWLDNVQLKLFSEHWNKDTDSQATEHANLQDDLKNLQEQLEQTTDACQILLTETGAQNSELIKQALSDIGHRLATLENEYKKREQMLSERNGKHRDFQDEMRKYQRWINESKGKLTVPDDLHDASLEEKIQQNQLLVTNLEIIEEEVQEKEELFHQLMEQGESLLSQDPSTLDYPMRSQHYKQDGRSLLDCSTFKEISLPEQRLSRRRTCDPRIAGWIPA